MKRTQMLSLGYVVAGGLAAAALCSQRKRRNDGKTIAPHVQAARSFNRSSALLAWSVLADSSVEHYRGSFTNPAMLMPLIASCCSLAASLHGGGDRRPRRHPLRHAIYRSATGVAVIGTAFHCYNIGKRPGGWCWNNLFYAAPLGAPTALLLSGLLGDTAERLREQPEAEPRLFGMPAWRAMALLCAAGMLGSAGEAALLHFRGSFQHRAMYAPILLPPVAATLLTYTAASPTAARRWPARFALKLTTWLGFIGTLFHIRGVARYHGGWRNWRQNLLCGPPVPAPPSFTALATAAQAALNLQKAQA
jgi:hypothetical protein